MKVHLTFDVEVWCDGWDRLDETFPHHYERCVLGRSRHGDYALPVTLDVLRRNGLTAVFFVEVMFSARFGAVHLQRIVDMLRADGHQVQLHIHTEWLDEISHAVIPSAQNKRRHLTDHDLADQTSIIAFGKDLLTRAGGGPVGVFRAGNFAVNRATFEALRRNDIPFDSSINVCFDVSGADLRAEHSFRSPFLVDGVTSFPIATFRDGLGRLRPAQVGACSFEEMRDALLHGLQSGQRHFVILSHNVELLNPGSNEPDRVVVSRFEKLCAFLAEHSTRFDVCGYDTPPLAAARSPDDRPEAFDELRSRPAATMRRHVEQIRRRVSHKLTRRS